MTTITEQDESTHGSLRRVFANPNLRRIQLAWFASVTGDWAYATALTVWAFLDGGAAAVGAFTAARFIATAFASPLGAVIADKMPRKNFMIITDLTRAVLVALAAIIVAVDGPAAWVYAIGMVVSIVGAPFRSAQAGLIPQLVNRPDELTASNAVAANLENLAIFVGPSLGALLVGAFDVSVVFGVNVATYFWSVAMVMAVRVRSSESDVVAASASEVVDLPVADSGADDEGPGGLRGFLSELALGFTYVARDADLRRVSVLAAAQGFVWGTLAVFMVVMAVDILKAGPQGVGFLDAVMGVATVAGGATVLTRVGKGKLGQDMALGVLGWSLPMIGMALFPSPVAIFAGLALIGLSDPWVNLGLETIPQRLSTDEVISRVYGAVESALRGAMALGAALAPVMMHGIGFRQSLAAVGIVVGLYTLTTFRHMRRLDARLAEPEHLGLLRSIDIFAPLAPPTLEALARAVEPVSVPAGAVILREGEASDRFYIIVSGSVHVTAHGDLLRTESNGDYFGEIGLLRDVPRTATVTALEPTELLALERDDFLGAVSGVGDSRRAADDVIARRLSV